MWLVALVAAAIGAALLGAPRSSAAPAGGTSESNIDATYSCPVRHAHYIDLYGSPTLPPVDNQPQPGVLSLTTGVRASQQNGALIEVAQVSLTARKNSLRIDKKSCRRVNHQIPLTPKGLPRPPTVATPDIFGHVNGRCVTSARVLVRLRLKTTNHTPTHALLAVRNENAKSRPIAFYTWNPRKVTGYSAKSCVSTG